MSSNSRWRCLAMVFAVTVGGYFLSAAELVAADLPRPGPRDPAFVPLGIYWAGEHTFQDLNDESERWKKIEAALDDLAAHHVNALWLTHLPAAETARVARLAEPRGIHLIASLGELAGDVGHIRKSDHPALIKKVREAWGDAPPPIAWGLGDEPKPDDMDEMAAYAKAWKTEAAGEPVTTVVTWAAVPTAGRAGFDALAVDVYPFFGAGGGYPTTPWNAWLTITRSVVAQVPRPWMMGQAFQEPQGPFTADDQGNVVYLPGSKPVWVMPTPEQVTWQAWTAFAEGSRGVYFFIYRWPVAKATDAPAEGKTQNSGSPRGLTYQDGRATPQYEALGKTYGRLQELSPILARLRPDPAGFTQVRSPRSASSMARVLKHEETERRYLFVVAGYDGAAEQELQLSLGPDIVGLKAVGQETPVKLSVLSGLRAATIKLPKGRGELFECELDADNPATIYHEDFSTDRLQKDSQALLGVQRHENSLWGHVLSAMDKNSKWPQAGVVYDLNKLLPAMPPGGARMLVYEGHATPPESRGVLWSTSSDGKSYRDVSKNEFNSAVVVRPRYLRVCVTWNQAGDHLYGYLSRFTIWQWKRAADAKK